MIRMDALSATACETTARSRRVPVGVCALDEGGLSEGWPSCHRQILRRLRAARRILMVLAFTPVACVVQSVLLVLPGRGKVRFARFYWAAVCRLIGLDVQVIGVPASGCGRPVVFALNHSSWLDIPVAGGILPGCFISKDDVRHWPLVGIVARLGRSVFVSRNRSATGRERADMQERLASGDNLVLFPEGTSSDGSRVLAFRTSFFAVAEGETRPLVQPVSLVYDRLAGLPVGRASRSVFAWYGDMSLAPHAWRLAQWRGLRATLLLHAPLDPADFESRKALASAAYDAVSQGCASLRQNRATAPAAACRQAHLATPATIAPVQAVVRRVFA